MRTYPHHRFIQCYTHHGRIGVLVEFALETWLVTKSPEFAELSQRFARHIAIANPSSLEELLQQAYASEPATTVDAALTAAAALLGERVTVTRFVRWDTGLQPPRDPPGPTEDSAGAIEVRRT